MRQPVHTVYGGAHLFSAGTIAKIGAVARKTLETFAPDIQTFAEVVGVSELPAVAWERMLAKLTSEPVEDYRIDFEDGYGVRSDAEEDQHARAAGALLSDTELPPFFGIRIKPLTEASRHRALRTLYLFLSAARKVPEGFLVTLPKVTSTQQIKQLLAAVPAQVRIELMIETPDAIVDSEGRFAIPALLDACDGRCQALHFGPYDYTASLGITAEAQSLDHPACDFARSALQLCANGRVNVSDGPTGLMPVSKTGDRGAVHSAMRDHYRHVSRALRNGFYQGWDLHPGQLPTRYAAVYSFFWRAFPAAAARLRNFQDRKQQATTTGTVFDDEATVRGLRNFFQRGLDCRAFEQAELPHA
jgi:citrate lyase beta subunit